MIIDLSFTGETPMAGKSKKGEQTSKPIAKIASKALKEPKSVTPTEIKKMAGSVLTQTPDKPKSTKKK